MCMESMGFLMVHGASDRPWTMGVSLVHGARDEGTRRSKVTQKQFRNKETICWERKNAQGERLR